MEGIPHTPRRPALALRALSRLTVLTVSVTYCTSTWCLSIVYIIALSNTRSTTSGHVKLVTAAQQLHGILDIACDPLRILRGATQLRRGTKHLTPPRRHPPASEPDAAPPSTVRPKKKGPRRGQPQWNQWNGPPEEEARYRADCAARGIRDFGSRV